MSDVALAESPIVAPDEETRALMVSPERVVALNEAAFMPAPWEDLQRAAILIASAPGMSQKLRTQEAAMFVAYQAARFGSDPIALASKVYFTGSGDKERIGYEAQWVMALIESDPLLQEPLEYAYGYSDPTKPSALNRFCRVTGKLLARSGRVVTRSVTSPTVAQIGVKNSPLWFSDPDQQLAYYTARLFGRRHRPARILGLYTREEIEALEAPAGRPALFEEDDQPAFDTVGPSERQTTAGATWEKNARNKAEGVQESRDPRDAPENRGAPLDPPPDNTGNKPADTDEIKEWAEGERKRIIALTDIKEVTRQGAALKEEKRFRRLVTYDRADAARITRSIANRISELEAE